MPKGEYPQSFFASRNDRQRQVEIVRGAPITEVYGDYFRHFRAEPDTANAATRSHDLLGLTLFPSSAAGNACPLVVLGRRCRSWRTKCICSSPLNDHGDHYKDADGRRVVVWEPYGFDALELAELAIAADAEGLRVQVTPASPWYPGRTLALVFRKAES